MTCSEERKFWQSQGICPICRKRRIYGEEKQCLECNAYSANWKAKKFANMTEEEREEQRRKDREQRAKLREKRLSQGLCVKCGKENSDKRYKNCPICREKQRNKTNYHDERIFYQSLGVCPVCHKNKLFGDEKQCVECKAKHYNYSMSAYEKDKENYNKRRVENDRKLSAERKQKGLCIRCARKKPSGDNHSYCPLCRAKAREKKNASYEKRTTREQWIANGLCCRCGEPTVKGHKLCEKHYTQICERNKEMAKDHVWKKISDMTFRERMMKNEQNLH